MTTTPTTATLIAQKDTTFTKIFVGGLPYHTTDQSLREYFDKFGDIDEAVVITDRQTGKSRGYGFVTMASKMGAEAAIREPNPIIDGRKANVNLAYLGAKPRVNAGIASALTTFKAGIPTAVLQNQYGYRSGGTGGLEVHTQAWQGFPTAQYVYPSHYLTTGGLLAAFPHSPLSPTSATTASAATQYIDYPSYASQFAAATGFEAYPYATAASQFGVPAAYATYAQLPGQLTATGAGHFAAYQSQIGDRLQ